MLRYACPLSITGPFWEAGPVRFEQSREGDRPLSAAHVTLRANFPHEIDDLRPRGGLGGLLPEFE